MKAVVRGGRALRSGRRRKGGGSEHPARHLVIGIENLAGDGGRPASVGEDPLVGRQVDVEVVERAAANPGTLNHVDVAKRRVLEEAVRATLLPEGVGANLTDRAREVAPRPALAALQNGDRAAGLGQPAGDDGAAEAGADNDHVVGVAHAGSPLA